MLLGILFIMFHRVFATKVAFMGYLVTFKNFFLEDSSRTARIESILETNKIGGGYKLLRVKSSLHQAPLDQLFC